MNSTTLSPNDYTYAPDINDLRTSANTVIGFSKTDNLLSHRTSSKSDLQTIVSPRTMTKFQRDFEKQQAYLANI